MHNIIFFHEKKQQKYVCLPYLKFSEPLPEARLLFYLASCTLRLLETPKWTKHAISLGSEENGGSVLKCLTRDRGVAGSSLTGGISLCP